MPLNWLDHLCEGNMPATVNRVAYNILAKDIALSAAFYQRLAGFQPVETDDFRIVMAQPGLSGMQLVLIDQVSEFVPRAARGVIQGSYITLVVDDVGVAVALARGMGVEVIEEPAPGKTTVDRAVIRDPNGLVIDLATPAALSTLPPRHSVA